MRTVALLFSLGLTLAAETLVIGHRGCRAVHPENTMTAFRAALAARADILELDVVVTRDNQLVVHHDLALEGKAVRSLSLAEVKAFDRGGTPSPNFPRQRPNPGERIPTLVEVLEFARAKRATLMIETKVDPDVDPAWFAKTLHGLLVRYGQTKRTLLQSFDHRTLEVMHRLDPEMRLVLLNPAKLLPDYIGPAKALGPKAIQFVNFRVVTAEVVAALHAAKIPVFSGTTDDPAEWTRLLALGVDGILTDDPAALRASIGGAK